ncbi:class I SAM-dependent methyltransferase [Pseudobdellovibrio exovorus]|uniref:Methyltransferase domain-containing protein n=1 Tax=Pseudobdellovibrio exovorus JSS TaxID=1184267 RepID=M4V806_9BACT|nr:class I SAM-dependent methyltransferase [Pseudobdellovibrio exovorus]AGH95353.1 hypothetical protein A11Q_1137 [Pseudobdellovibrio exovorus JSS]
MNKPTTPPDFFTKELSLAYDERNSKLSPISENLHFLIRLAIQDLPTKSHILCIGVGTGAEILSLAKAFPEWTFLGVDPSASMLEVCAERLQIAGVSERCQLVCGYVQDVPKGEKFDAVLSVLVAHFVRREERLDFFQNMVSRLKSGGYLVNAEISCDLNAPEFPLMLKGWEQVQTLMGATPESLAGLPQQLRTVLNILPNSETEDILRQSGILSPTKFFQSFMISAWYGKK